MPKLLLIDDDPALLEILCDYLERAGYTVAAASSGSEGLKLAEASTPDLLVLDVAMPEMDGWQVLKSLRERSPVPVILLTARTEEADVLQGFSLGADDYVAKPFSFAQLEARIRAVLNRGERPGAEPVRTLAHGDLTVDLDAHRVSRGGAMIKLTPTEFRLLVALMEQPGKIFSADQLVRKVWGDQYASESDYVRRYIWYLRQKVEADPDQPRYIRNERNVGYYFSAESPDS